MKLNTFERFPLNIQNNGHFYMHLLCVYLYIISAEFITITKCAKWSKNHGLHCKLETYKMWREKKMKPVSVMVIFVVL